MNWQNFKGVLKPNKSKFIVFLSLILVNLLLIHVTVVHTCSSNMASTASCMYSYSVSARGCVNEVIHKDTPNRTLVNESLWGAQIHCNSVLKETSKALEVGLKDLRLGITISSFGLVDQMYPVDTPLHSILLLIIVYYLFSCAGVTSLAFLLKRR